MNNWGRFSLNNRRYPNNLSNCNTDNINTINSLINNTQELTETTNLNNVNNIQNPSCLNRANLNSYSNENLSELLFNYIGQKCICEFNTGDGLESKTGILEKIGNDFIVLRSLNNSRMMYCYLSNLMFVTIVC